MILFLEKTIALFCVETRPSGRNKIPKFLISTDAKMERVIVPS